MKAPPLEAVIFDMDGVLLDSEPLWQEAEIAVFATVGVHLTREQCQDTMGMRIDEVVAYRHAQQPWDSPSLGEVAEQVVDGVIALVRARGTRLPGVGAAIEAIRGAGLRIGLATSSAYRIIDAILATLDLEDVFEVCHSAEEEPYGKPHPGVFITCAGRMGVDPLRCLAIEDSANGVVSARAARMRCVAVPDRAVAGRPEFAIADAVLGSLLELTPEVLASL